MIKVGELDKISNSIKSWNKIHFGGLIKNMMENYGILTTIEPIWFKRLEESKEFLNIHFLKVLIFQHGRDCFGKKHQVSKSQWSTRNSLMRRDLVLIRFQIEDLHYGGLQLLIELMYMSVFKFN